MLNLQFLTAEFFRVTWAGSGASGLARHGGGADRRSGAYLASNAWRRPAGPRYKTEGNNQEIQEAVQ